MRWYMQMSVGVSEGWVRASLQSQRAQLWAPVAHTRPPVEQPRPRSRRSAKWGPEDNTLCYGQEKKLWVNIAICLNLSLSLSICLSHITEASTPLENKVQGLYSYKTVLWSFFIPCIFPRYGYTILTMKQNVACNKKKGDGYQKKQHNVGVKLIITIIWRRDLNIQPFLLLVIGCVCIYIYIYIYKMSQFQILTLTWTFT